MNHQRVLILGGGLAGLATAVALRNADAGFHITLVEAANRLGGRAASFTDSATNQRIDNCQHVVMGCCTNLLHFYRSLGVDHHIQWHDQYHFADPQGHIQTLKPSAFLPAPLHLAPSFLRFTVFPLKDRLAIAAAMRTIMATPKQDHTDETFATFLKRIGQPEHLINRFWNVVIISACNLGVQHVQAAAAIFFFQQGFLANRASARLGLPDGPLADLYDPAAQLIDDLRISSRITAIQGKTHITNILLDDHTSLTADCYVCALPFHVPPKLFDQALMDADPRIIQSTSLTFSPILAVHLTFDHALSNRSQVAFLDAPTHWIFFKDQGTRAHAVISAASKWMSRSRNDIIDAVLADLQTIAPSATRDTLTDAKVIKEKRATYAPFPNADSAKPTTTGSIHNCFIAGDHTDPDWPATMEAAVRSGYRAASAIVGRDLLQPPLHKSPLYRLLSSIPTF